MSLTDDAHELLLAVVDVDPDELAQIPRVDEAPRHYEFDSGAGVSAPVEVDRGLVGWLTELPAARRLPRACRRPTDRAAVGQATWLYLVELAPGGEVAAVRSQLPIGDATHGVVEVHAVGEDVPPYHVEALLAARAVWSRDT